jgi:enoyl-CoA hydratase/carnithine racemase
MTSALLVTRDEGVAVVEFSVPDRRNALCRALLEELQGCLTGGDVAGSTAVVLVGAGSVFSAGADLAELTGTAEDRTIDDLIGNVVHALRHLPVPVIAAVEGACIGAGLDLMLACDLAVASSTAFFEVPAARLGLLYNPVALARWQRVLRRSVLRRMLLLGERLDARTALEAEMVARVVPAGMAKAESITLARRALTGDAATATKLLLVSLEDGAFDARDWEAERQRLLSSPARRQAVAAAKAGTNARAGAPGEPTGWS